MNIVEQFEVSTPDDVEFLEYLTLDPQPDHLILRAKSKIFRDWFRSLVSGEKSASKKWSGSYYVLPPHMNLATENTFLDGVGRSLVQPSQHGNGFTYNLSWLRHTKLDEGCVIEIPGVIGMAEFEDYFNVCAERLQKMYVKHIRRSVVTLRLKEKLNVR
jgi:hypothetical protein